MGMGGDSMSHGHHHSWHQVSLGMGLGDASPGTEVWHVGACGAAQGGQVGFHRAGKQRQPIRGAQGGLA